MYKKKVERTVLVTDNGEEVSLMERPNGLGTIKEYFRKVEEYRKQHPELFERLPTTEEYIREKRKEAVREWEE